MTEKQRPLRAVILAAGQGKRMKSSTPKVLHDVLGLTILSRVINAVSALGTEHLHIVVGHEAEQIKDFIAKHHSDLNITTHLQQPQLGTGHALMQVAPDLKSFKGDLIVTVGDAPLLTADTLKPLLDTHRQDDAVVTILSTIVPDSKNYGRVLRDAKQNVVGIVEDKDANDEQRKVKEINAAIYCFKWPEIEAGLAGLKNENKQGEYYLPDLAEWAVGKGFKLSASVAEDHREVAGINSRLELSEAIRHLRDLTIEKLALESGVTVVDPQSTWIAPEATIGQETVVLPGTHIMGNVKIGGNCTIGPNAVIRGNVVIGANSSVVLSMVVNSTFGEGCKIGPFSHVREGNSVGNEVKVGNFVEIKKCTIGNNTNISHLSYIGDTTLGSKSNIGAGTITANYDHLKKLKHNTVIGDGVATGSNSVIVAPVTIGDRAVIAAGSVVTKDVPGSSLAVSRARQTNIDGWSDR
ncbi:MAG: bifunctional UDP-N-acetylglucosamine diphosphorylase/glucosamine-1-phosphate N-acetyltransferase GlmU [Candidatus Melainabacteria bacterium]|nr:bifunctional UDP-N-acetylglucosamine diphosphorylase/glucosamine-1-phosphate N-acetyltransferase GlmU [Candidatus Melainabacteria bacterium]